jgi:hypothetical protein
MPRRLERLTITPPSPSSSAIGFIAYHKDQPVNDFNYLSRPETLVLDWQDPWYTHFSDSDLVRHDATALASYLYVDPFQIRHYIIMRVKALSTVLTPDLNDRSFIGADEWDELKQRMGEFLQTKNALSVDNQSLQPRLDQTHFVEYDEAGGVRLLQQPRRLDFAAAHIGAALFYDIDDRPGEMSLQWDLFTDKVRTVAVSVSTVNGENQYYQLTPESNGLLWQNPLIEGPAENDHPTAEDIPDFAGSTHYRIPIASVVCLLLLVPVAWWLSIRYRDDQPIHLQLVMAGLLLWAGGALAPYWHLEIAKPAGLIPRIEDQKAIAILDRLLGDTYRSFNARSEQAIRERLMRSVDAAVVDKIYQPGQRARIVDRQDEQIGVGGGGGGGVISRIELVEASVRPRADAVSGFSFDAQWTVSAGAGQWDRISRHASRYNAVIDIAPDDGAWKITGFDLLDEQSVAVEPASD